MTNNPTIDGVSRELPPCKQVVYQEGISCGLFDIPKATAENICKNISTATGCEVDWHYIGGRVHIKALPNFEVAALQSTIAQLQARVQELESGRGEPVAWANGEQLKLCAASPREVQPNNPMMHNLPRNIAGSALKTDYCNTPLFTATPAPVAVELLRKARGSVSYLSLRGDDVGDENHDLLLEIDACLDATAALNGERK